MKKFNFLILLVLTGMTTVAKSQVPAMVPTTDQLIVVWTSGDPYVADKVALMYTHAAKTQGWFKEVTLVIWGPSQKLITENKNLQEKVRSMQKDGVITEACIACSNSYGITEELRKLGYDVKGMGKPLSEYLKSGAKVLTF